MGRFKRLETDEPEIRETEQSDNSFGLKRVLSSKKNEPAPQHPEYDQGHYKLEGDRHFFDGDFKAALRGYSRSVQADHSRPEPWIGQILTLIMMSQYREATIWMLRSLEQFPEEPALLSLQSLVYGLSGFQNRALAAGDYVLTRPNSATPFVWAIRAHLLSLLESPNAGPCFDKFQEFSPGIDWKLYATIGMLQLKAKKWNRAKEFLEKAIRQNNSVPYLWRELGFVLERLSFTEEALQAYRSALELNPNDREAYSSLTRLKTTPLPIRVWRRIFGRSR